MKKNLFYIMLLLLTSSVTFTSCDDDSTAGVTSITYYPVLSLNGDATLHVDKGSAFVDPGCAAEMNGEDISSSVVVSGSVNTAKSGIYTLTYSASNDDGFSASVSRRVIVTDPNDAHEGLFVSDAANSVRDYNGAQTKFGGSYEVVITNNDDGTYHVTDLLGGW